MEAFIPLRLRPWLLWLVLFYSLWLVVNIRFGLWPQVLMHWPIAAAMAVGSYVAGSTPMGGGTVGFPILVLLFDLPASLGRNFALVIQSIGMTSAGIFILCRRSAIEARMLKHVFYGAGVGLMIGTFLIVPLVADDTVKLIFACLWASFGVLTLVKNRELCELDALPVISHSAAWRMGWLVGIAGGVTTSLTGVGIDMMLYTVLVLLFRVDLKIAIPTSVIVMAATSLMGTALHLVMGDLDHQVFYYWLAASPVVIVGAPLGAWLVSIISRMRTLYFVGVLCVLQFFWALYEVQPTWMQWGLVLFNIACSALVFVFLYRLGKRLASERVKFQD